MMAQCPGLSVSIQKTTDSEGTLIARAIRSSLGQSTTPSLGTGLRSRDSEVQDINKYTVC